MTEIVRDKLTQAEILQAGEELAAIEKELQAAREERKSTIASIAARMNAAGKRIQELADQIQTGFRSVEVEVLRIVKPGEDHARIIRADTNELVRTEALTWPERQERLFGDSDERPGPG